MARELPRGVQDFDKLRERGMVYIDKTAYLFRLVHTGNPYFLARPRRFVKSLLVSAPRALWEGRKELFEGLAIYGLESARQDACGPLREASRGGALRDGTSRRRARRRARQAAARING